MMKNSNTGSLTTIFVSTKVAFLWLLGLITTTTRKLDREQQAEHFLEVRKMAHFLWILSIIFSSGHATVHPTINRDRLENSSGRSKGSINCEEWFQFWARGLGFSKFIIGYLLFSGREQGGEELVCPAFDKHRH